ncbi:MAG: hypothetical protein ACRDV9_06865 [Acidimicrobiia bacterium]
MRYLGALLANLAIVGVVTAVFDSSVTVGVVLGIALTALTAGMLSVTGPGAHGGPVSRAGRSTPRPVPAPLERRVPIGR